MQNLLLRRKNLLLFGVVAASLLFAVLTFSRIFAEACPCSVFAPTDTPGIENTADGNAIELGMKFRSDEAGEITAIRFYKSTQNIGTHIGTLWSSSGQVLGSVTFQNESSSGWQQADLAAPVTIAANTTYIVSYHSPTGNYSASSAYFTTAKDTAPLHGLANGTDGSNGVFSYGNAGTFPTSSYNSNNYFVDVVFENGASNDTTPPTVSSVNPADQSVTAGTGTNISVQFNEPLSQSSVSAATVTLNNSNSQPVAASISYQAGTNMVVINPDAELVANSTYTVILAGGAGTVITDTAGNALASNYSWSFTTASTYCGDMKPVACENTRAGTPKSEWDGLNETAGDLSIQGFSTDISVNKGASVDFKVNTPSTSYELDIYRLGYYGGAGARLITTLAPSASLPQTQPACANDSATGLVDCGNWSVSASWAVPSDAVSGVYLAKLNRLDTTGSSHIIFIVRDDTSTSDIIYQTADTTWGAAYNDYGGNSLYTGSPVGRAYKVSYNRPLLTRNTTYKRTHFFANELPMIRWIEANGYDASYMSGVDTDRMPASYLQQHKVFISSGHDEYWSGTQRDNVEAARDNGVNLAFFSGNEVFWKTRWENSIDGTGTPHRTLVSYKETAADAKIDPSSEWTGTWRDPRFSPPSDGGRPENALTGTIFTVNCCVAAGVVVPAEEGMLRLWRNTAVAGQAPGSTVTLTPGTIGFEADEDVDNGFRPAGLVPLSSTPLNGISKLQNFGNQYATGNAVHSLTQYRAPSGALVFGAGTVRWSWGLDNMHDDSASAPGSAPDLRMQQATVNLFADMDNTQPSTPQPGIVPATQSNDTSAPVSIITTPVGGAQFGTNAPVSITGTASDVGGQVGVVEVSVDNGVTWTRAQGRSNWSVSTSFINPGQVTILTRATDDTGNMEAVGSGTTINIVGGLAQDFSIFDLNDVPAVINSNDTSAVELGVKFRPTVNGVITGIRFYKALGNTGTHTGSLWTSTGQLLGTVTFQNETASGWQQATFTNPVAVTAGTTYVASYFAPQGNYSVNSAYFTADKNSNNLVAPSSGSVGGNGVFAYGAQSAFPTQSYNSSNYWVDVVFNDLNELAVVSTTPSNQQAGVAVNTNITAVFNMALQSNSVSGSTVELRDQSNSVVAASVTYNTSTSSVVLDPTQDLQENTTYTLTIRGGQTEPTVKDSNGTPLSANYTLEFSTASTTPPANGQSYSVFAPTDTPAIQSVSDADAVELGMKFTSDKFGVITGVRFFKGSSNTGTHVGNLWDTSGNNLATVTFQNETASGWQEALFSQPVAVEPNTTYIVSYYAPNGRFAMNTGYFASSGVNNGPLHALANGVDGGNGVFIYGGSSAFPTNTYASSNYWVDVVFEPTVNSIFAPTDIPATVSVSDASSVELGLKFQSDVDGKVTGVRFYKSAENIGTHIGSLWSSTGTLLASVTFSNESASGWQQATFSQPVAISADTTYVISYFAPNGRYSANSAQFSSTGLVNAPLRALPNSEANGNGVYKYGASSVFPTDTFNATNYWVDVTFEPTAGSNEPPLSQGETLFSTTDVPAIPALNESDGVELGMKFSSSVSGVITGVRFYKGTGNSGTHVGNVWSATGVNLGTVTFTSESGSGWQQADFTSPIAITANTPYVVSYFAPNGHFAVNAAYFNTPKTTGSLTAPSSSGSGGNGVFAYGSSSAFPAQTYNASNYWVDVVFQAE